MKTYQSLKYLLFAGMVGVWGCSSQQYVQTGEYDDLYFSSKDREQVTLTASASAKNYSNIDNKGIASEDYSQKNVNPDYIQQYADQNRNQSSSTNNNDSYSADDNSYYDENYTRNNRPIDLARDYTRYNNNRGTNINVFPSIGFGGFYGGPAFYDPFYDPFFGNAYYDPFFHRPFGGRPGWNINISYNYGWGNPWGWGRSAYWYDPFFNPYRSWGAWGDPYFNGFYGRPYYGWGGGWNRGNNIIVVNPGNNDSRQTRYSPRSSRGSAVVNDNFDNTPRTNRDSRGGRVDQTEGAAGTNPSSGYANEGRRPSNISADESRPARAVRPRSDANPDYQPQNTQPGNNNSGNRTYSPNVNSGANDGVSTNPRAVRPRSNSDSYQNQNSNNRYYDSNRSSAPTYNSTPSTGRSPRSYDNSRSNSNNNSWSNDSYRSNSGSNNSNSGRSYSTPSSSPSSSPSAPSRSSGSSGSSGSPRRSPR
jgi:uncharacterized membrane protein YgcG